MGLKEEKRKSDAHSPAATSSSGGTAAFDPTTGKGMDKFMAMLSADLKASEDFHRTAGAANRMKEQQAAEEQRIREKEQLGAMVEKGTMDRRLTSKDDSRRSANSHARNAISQKRKEFETLKLPGVHLIVQESQTILDNAWRDQSKELGEYSRAIAHLGLADLLIDNMNQAGKIRTEILQKAIGQKLEVSKIDAKMTRTLEMISKSNQEVYIRAHFTAFKLYTDDLRHFLSLNADFEDLAKESEVRKTLASTKFMLFADGVIDGDEINIGEGRNLLTGVKLARDKFQREKNERIERILNGRR